MLYAEWFNKLNLDVPTKKLGGGYYMFGTKKIFCRIMNGNLTVRVGGGFLGIEEFVDTYGEVEKEKFKK